MDVPPYVIWVYGMSSAGFLMNIAMCGLSLLVEYISSQKTLVGYQLQTLQHQITPHFMFNVLNHIHVLMETDVRLASDLLIKYSEILRYQLYNGEKKGITIEQEVQFLKDFIAVEQLRWGDRLAVECHWEIEDKCKEIPSLLFITFVENAFKHVAKSVYEKGFVEINFHQQGKTLRFEIKNSKPLIQFNKVENKGLGLKNIKERLDIMYPRKHDLRIDETNEEFYAMLTIQI
ncbi:MAG: histidine kinase [Tannerella sp.]|jgi:LytS/YehU family sensor histidine kinase|nr:histidine kinase [Tannerella sp.]